MLISKAQFIYYANKYKEAHEEQKKFHDALRPYFDFPICTYRYDLVNAYESLLVAISECYDEDGIFSWWVSDSHNDDKRITVKLDAISGSCTDYFVETAEGLYDYLYDTYHNAG